MWLHTEHLLRTLGLQVTDLLQQSEANRAQGADRTPPGHLPAQADLDQQLSCLPSPSAPGILWGRLSRQGNS